MMKVALDIVTKTLFNSDVSEAAEQVAAALETIFSYSEFYMGPVGLVISKLPLPVNRPFFDAIKLLDDILLGMIREHRATGDQGDLLSMLLNAQDEDDGGRMTDRQVRNEAITLFLAGHETTAVALTWTWYLLSQHSEIEQKLHEELDDVLGGREPGAGDYPRLDYTYRVFKEAMRLYPPAYLCGRQAIRDTKLGPYSIAKGNMVIVAPCTIQRSSKYYDNPDAFDPDRWLPERCEGLHKFAYLPFGGGLRKCVGEPFAWMEGVLVLATIAQRWRVELHPDHEVGFAPAVTLRPKGGLPVIVHRR